MSVFVHESAYLDEEAEVAADYRQCGEILPRIGGPRECPCGRGYKESNGALELTREPEAEGST